ncbi:glycosyltransferase [Ornithinimicrobium sufpigmenti]|uniref:glycosyltransferase n=1 Tax=Ornithinimicrobium sufpigmenti TaxID=2508882 RepID=UPI001036C236|nr:MULTISPECIES: glycosyltransferase [unclassified Ornithinimicrobium]
MSVATDGVNTDVADQAENGERPLRIVVVAMKPMLRGRIRRNIMTFLELGAEVTVVNTPPRDDFFQGLESPRLHTRFVEARSAAVRYQAWMSRQNVLRKEKWAREREEARARARLPVPVAPEWMQANNQLAALAYRGWTSPPGRRVRGLVEERWPSLKKKAIKRGRELRKKRDLAIRDGLKKFHPVNRFVEFWWLSPDEIAALDPDLIVSSDLPGLVGANIAARRLGRPHLHDCHELYLESTTLKRHERLLLWPVERHYMRRADAIVIVNQTIRDEYQRRYGVDGVVLRNCAPRVPASVRADPIDVRGLLGLAPEAHVVLYQGGLMAGRGLDVCVRAAAHFPDGAHLVFIGDGREKQGLVALAQEVGVRDRVHWLPAVPPAELPAYTAAASVGLIPYQPVSKNNRYALPNKVFEYTGAGVPFVASDLPELRKIVETSGCGEVYDPYDPVALGSAVGLLLNGAHSDAFRMNAHAYGRSNTWETERELLVERVHSLTDTHRIHLDTTDSEG